MKHSDVLVRGQETHSAVAAGDKISEPRPSRRPTLLGPDPAPFPRLSVSTEAGK